MWHLPKPDLQKTLDDVDVFEHLGIITSAENSILKKLVRDYDSNNACLAQQQLPTIPTAIEDRIHSSFELTEKGRNLYGIRQDLFNNVYQSPFGQYCPYCGINEIGTLDHYMDKSSHKALALCRLNLVPMCMRCNGPKSNKPYTDFVNPYYLSNPGVEFFICNITIIANDVFYEFSIKNGIFTKSQPLVLNKQIDAIGLNDRWGRAVISYLQDDVFSEKNTPQLLIASLPLLIQQKKNTKMLNHWKAAVLRGLEERINGSDITAQIIIDAVNNKKYIQNS